MKKDVDIEELITLNYEIEGLLYLALHRGNDTPEGVWRMIEEKVRLLNDAFADSEMEIGQASAVAFESEPEPVAAESDPVVVPDESSEEEVVSTVVPDEPMPISEADVQESVEEREMQEDEVGIEEPSEKDVDEISDECEPEIQDVVNEQYIPEEETLAVDVEDDIDVPEVSEIADEEPSEEFEISVEEPVEESETLNEPAEEPVIRLDEKLARDNSKNLRRAFSINDRFRFRRELFSNSDTEMSDTLNMVEAMSSYAEAEDYFYVDLQWDSEMQEVKDFMDIIRKHFS